MHQATLYLYSLLIYIPAPGAQHVIWARIWPPPFFCRQAADLVRIIHFWLPSGAHRRNCGTSFCRQAADLVRLLHLGLFRAAHWLNCEPSFCRQAVDLVHVSDFGLATDAYWLATDTPLYLYSLLIYIPPPGHRSHEQGCSLAACHTRRHAHLRMQHYGSLSLDVAVCSATLC